MFVKIKNMFKFLFLDEANKRAATLEKMIIQGIAKYGIKLVDGNYFNIDENDDICGCAIGSALLSTARNKEEFLKLFNTYDEMPVKDIGQIALKVINNGIIKQELIDLEAGFECWTENDVKFHHPPGVFPSPNKTVDINSAFYQAGQRLRAKRAYNG